MVELRCKSQGQRVVRVGCGVFDCICTGQAVAEVGPVGAFDAELRQGAGSSGFPCEHELR